MNWTINQTVDLSRGYTPVVWPDALMVSGDVGAHTWRLTVLDNGVPADLSGATITGSFLRADGNTVLVSGTVSGNVASVTLSDVCYAVEGKMKGTIKMTKSGAVITLAAVIFTVSLFTSGSVIDPGVAYADFQIDASPAGTYADLSALISADPDHSKIYITLDDGKWCYHNGAAFVAGGVYQATTMNVNGIVKNDGSNNYTPAVTADMLANLLIYPEITNLTANGNFADGTTGFTISNMTPSVTDNVCTVLSTSGSDPRITLPFTCEVGKRYFCSVQVKTTSSSVRLTVGTSTLFAAGTSAWENLYVVHTATAEAHGVSLFDDRASDWDAIQVKNFTAVEIIPEIETVLTADLSAAINALPNGFLDGAQNVRMVDAGSTYTASWLKTTDPTGFPGVRKVSNLFNPIDANIVDGYFLTAGTGSLSANAAYAVSHYIPVTPGQMYTVSHSPENVACFYDDEYAYVSGLEDTGVPVGAPYDYTFKIPASIGYMRVNIRKATTVVADYVVSEGTNLLAGTRYASDWAEEVSTLSGMTVLVTGDSITESNFRASTNWHDYIADWLGCTVKNDGKSGTGLIRGNPGIPADGILARIDGWDAAYGAFDAVALMCNMNDGGLGPVAFPVGSFADGVAVQSQHGAVKATLEKLISKYPNKPIVWIISTPRKESYADVQPNGKAWGKDGWFEPYCQAILEVCAHYSIPCLDLYHESGLRPWNDTNNATYFSSAQDPQGDGVHPNAAGQRVMAHKISAFLKQHLIA